MDSSSANQDGNGVDKDSWIPPSEDQPSGSEQGAANTSVTAPEDGSSKKRPRTDDEATESTSSKKFRELDSSSVANGLEKPLSTVGAALQGDVPTSTNVLQNQDKQATYATEVSVPNPLNAKPPETNERGSPIPIYGDKNTQEEHLKRDTDQRDSSIADIDISPTKNEVPPMPFKEEKTKDPNDMGTAPKKTATTNAQTTAFRPDLVAAILGSSSKFPLKTTPPEMSERGSPILVDAGKTEQEEQLKSENDQKNSSMPDLDVSTSNSEAPPTSSKEEKAKDPSVTGTAPKKRATPNAQTTALRPDLVAAILGSSLKLPVKKTSTPPVAEAHQPSAQPKESKKKKQPKVPPRKVLKAKKEIDIAERVVGGKTDLVTVLSEKECRFLGEKLWIFTVQQLHAVLDGTEENERTAREELIKHLHESTLLPTQFSSNSGNTGELKPDLGESNRDAKDSGCEDQSKHSNGNATTDEKATDAENATERSPRNFSQGKKIESDAKNVEVAKNIPQVLSTIDVTPDSHRMKSITSLMESWKKSLMKAKSTKSIGRMEQFFLDGPVSVLIPRCTRNFLKSVKITTVFDFLSHKRTETGILVDMYISWRKECGLREITRLTIARHLVGLGARMELAIGSACPPSLVDRTWAGTHSIIFGGASKEFLCDIKIYNSNVFVNTKTKILSERLADWRVAQGLPPLKGTGKVAMISAWKTQIREAEEAEEDDGKVSGEEWYKTLEIEDSNPNPFQVLKTTSEATQKSKAKKVDVKPAVVLLKKTETPPASAKGKSSGSSSRNSKTELKSKSFLEKVLPRGAIEALTAAGVTTADQLMKIDTSSNSLMLESLSKELNKYWGEFSESSSDSHDNHLRIVSNWQKQVKSKLSTDDTLQEAKSSIVTKEPSKGTRNQETRAFPRKRIDDPWDALSATSQMFLKSINIHDAEAFLAAKTKDLAEALVKYREENDLPVLKGLGSVASISAWKALVRSAAKRVGKHELVTLNAGRNAGIKLTRRTKTEQENDDRSEEEKVQIATKSPAPQGNVAVPKSLISTGLIATEQTRFWVIGGDDAFCFVLSIRTCSTDKSRRLPYLTYLGCDKIRCPETTAQKDMQSSLSVLEHVFRPAGSECHETKPFNSSRSGLIEIGRYGFFTTPRRDDLGLIERVCRSFIFQESNPEECYENVAYNVFEKHCGMRKSYLFFQKTQIEKGQTVELNFLPPVPPELSGSNSDEKRRTWIAREVASLELKELRRLLDFLNDDILSLVDRDIHNRLAADEGTIEIDTRKSSPKLAKLVIARRRMHWLVLKINSSLQTKMKEKAGGAILLPPVSFNPLWKEQLVGFLQKHPAWSSNILPLLVAECKQEMFGEFRSDTFGDFSTTMNMWCNVANDAFDETVGLFSRYNVELGKFCMEEKLLEDILNLVSKSISKCKRFDGVGGRDCEDISLIFNRKKTHSSNVFPSSQTLWTRLNQTYLDSMSLCHEPPRCASLLNEGKFVVVVSSKDIGEASKPEAPCVVNVEDLDKGRYNIDTEWYIRAQVMAVVESAALCGVANIASTGPSALSNIQSRILDSVRAAVEGKEIARLQLERRQVGMEYTTLPVQLLTRNVTPSCLPGSNPVFLSIVWPVLKKLKWRAEAGDEPSSVTFSYAAKQSKRRERVMKQEAARARSKFARLTSTLGLGYIPKGAKRLFVACASRKDSVLQKDGNFATVAEALEVFEKSFVTGRTQQDRGKIMAIVGHFSTLFAAVAPSLIYEAEDPDEQLAEETRPWKDVLGCEYLMRFLLVMPNLLSQSDLTVTQKEHCVGVVTDLIDFLVRNHEKLFSSSYHLTVEQYEADFEFKKFILPRLAKDDSMGDEPVESEPVEEMGEIVLPSDRNDLTDFVCTVMDQLIVCRATHEDRHFKGKRASYLTIGMPGLMCRHCNGERGEGKYFYSNPQSLATASTSADKHILRCQRTSDEIKQKVIAAKEIQAAQRSQLPIGAQSAFYNRLWKRLQGYRRVSRLEDDTLVTLPDHTVGGGNSTEQDDKSDTSSTCTEFNNHVDLLNYIQNEEPWKSHHELELAIDKYYSCLAWGASIYNTPAMPAHYSTEVILRKLGHEDQPRQHH